MGKKATLLLSRILFAVLTFILAVLGVLAWAAGRIPPQESWLAAFIALGMVPLLIANFIAFVFWLFRLSWWAVIPLIAILVNINFMTATVRYEFRDNNHLSPDIKVATYNIHGYTHKDFGNMLSIVLTYFAQKGVDVVCLQEFCEREGLNLDSVGIDYPYYAVMSDNQCMKVAVFSKYPIHNSRLIRFDDSNNGGMTTDITIKGRTIHFINAHLQTTNLNQSNNEISQVKDYGIDTPEGKRAFDLIMKRLQENADVRKEQVKLIRKEIEKHTNDLLILCGDFNDPPSSYTYNQISEGLIDGFKECGHGFAYTFTPLYKLFRLDYILYSQQFKGIRRESPKLPWSDHNPVIIELVYSYSTK